MDMTQRNKISLVMPTYHPDRVERANELYKMLKLDSGVDVEVIMVCDNPEVSDKLKADFVVKLPKRVGWTKATNIGEKFTSTGLGWWIDDYVIPEPGWGPKALKGFYERFPDGMGIMEISGYETDCPKSISTRKFMYELNGGDWVWDEYLHCGDTESWYKATAMDKFYVYPEVLWHRDKIYDACKATSDLQRKFDVDLRLEREANGWPMTLTPHLQDRMEQWAIESGKESNIELYKNIYHLEDE